MASIDVGIHPDPAGIRSRHFNSDGSAFGGPFSTLECAMDAGRVDIYVHNLATLDAIQAALDEIRVNLPARLQTASDQVPTVMADWPAPGELMEIHGK